VSEVAGHRARLALRGRGVGAVDALEDGRRGDRDEQRRHHHLDEHAAAL
jgi:hypothetical protein